jgi:cobalt-zinc-cadmium efflux system outer membrane protein
LRNFARSRFRAAGSRTHTHFNHAIFMHKFLSALFLSTAACSLSAAPTTSTTPPAPPAPAQTAAAPASSPPAAARAPVSIAALVEQTVALNPEIRFYENEISLAKTRHDAAGRWNDPELSVEIGRKSSHEPGGAFAGDGLAWGVTLAQRFDFSGRNALRKAIASRQVERAGAGLAQFRRELAAKAAETGFALLAAQQRLEAVEAVAARGRALLETLVQRDPAGVAALLEARVIEADVLRLARDAALQRAALRSALADLNMLRGLPPAAPLVLANNTTPPASAAPGDAALLSAAFRENYTLRQFELELQEQGLAVDLERKNAFNDVTLSAYYSEERAGGKDRFMGLGVSVPLPFWSANRAGVAEARTRRGQAENALFKLRRDLHKDVLDAASRLRAHRDVLCATDAAKVAQFREAAALGDRHYRLGSIPVGTYVALQQAYLSTLENHLDTRIEAARAAARLTALTGLPLETFFEKPASAKAQGGAK